MCFYYTKWAINLPNLDIYQKSVLIQLCDYANQDGLCFPSQQTIADRLNISRQKVNTTLKSLKELGLIIVKNSNQYQVVKTECVNAVDSFVNTVDTPPVNTVDTIVNVVDTPVNTVDSHLNISINKSINKLDRKKKLSFKTLNIKTIPNEWLEYSKTKNLSEKQAIYQFERFSNYWLANGGTNIDWLAVWRNWILNQINKYGLIPEIKTASNDKNEIQAIIQDIDKGVFRWTYVETRKYKMNEKEARQLIKNAA